MDRRFPDGVYFGETEVAQRSFDIFVASATEFLVGHGARATPALAQRLATTLLSAAHGAIALPLGTPTIELLDARTTGRLLIENLVDAFAAKLQAARKTVEWPTVSIRTFR
jgi:hypothetical protein